MSLQHSGHAHYSLCHFDTARLYQRSLCHLDIENRQREPQMTTPTEARRRPNGHDHTHVDDAAGTCPLCGSTLTGTRYREAVARMERVEKERMAALETSLKTQFANQQRTAAVKAAA